MAKTLIDLIDTGRIKTLEDLKSAYHKIVMKTHPDAIGSNKLLPQYLSLTDQYEEAKKYLSLAKDEQKNLKPKFSIRLGLTEAIDKLNAQECKADGRKIISAKEKAQSTVERWEKDWTDLYDKENNPVIMIVPHLPNNIIAFRIVDNDLYLIRAHKDQRLTLYKVSGADNKLLQFFMNKIESSQSMSVA
jgi:curved DNA-binding protein CbpA